MPSYIAKFASATVIELPIEARDQADAEYQAKNLLEVEGIQFAKVPERVTSQHVLSVKQA